MHQKNNSSSTMKNNLSSKSTIPQKENDSSLESKHKVMEYCNLTDRVFKISVMRKLSELQGNTETQFNIRKTTNAQNEKFNRDRNQKIKK